MVSDFAENGGRIWPVYDPGEIARKAHMVVNGRVPEYLLRLVNSSVEVALLLDELRSQPYDQVLSDEDVAKVGRINELSVVLDCAVMRPEIDMDRVMGAAREEAARLMVAAGGSHRRAWMLVNPLSVNR